MLNQIQNTSKKINEYAAIASGILLGLAALTIVAYALARAFFDTTLFRFYYWTQIAMSWLIFMGFAYALITGVHVKVTLVLTRLPLRFRRWLDVVVCAIGSVFCIVLSVTVWPYFWESFRIKENVFAPMGIIAPLWLAKLGMALGISFFLIQFIIDFIQAIRLTR
jgi:TRAP-type C4-dicarboxylate transport system permease small subunit